MIDEPKKRRFYAVSYEDDIPTLAKGSLIPKFKTKKKVDYLSLAILPLTVLMFLVSLGAFGTEAISSMNTASIPKISVFNQETEQTEPFNYGVQIAMSKSDFFSETREAFIDAEVSFLEVDLVAMNLRYFEKGVLSLNMPISSKAGNNSRCQVPAGIYQIDFKKDNYFSNVGQVNLPWSLGFQNNFYIHGWSTLPNNEFVKIDFSGDCIRLEPSDAKDLFNQVKINTPVLVHEKEAGEGSFLYEPRVPDLAVDNYLVADLESNTVLASGPLDRAVPIASLTKLMTALVMVENINLDKNIQIKNSSLVDSLVPRLEQRNSVSAYNLLQLILLESSNEATEVVAGDFGREEFIALMNSRAKSLGMLNTHFADPSGLSAENVSSVGDLLRLIKEINKNRNFIFELTAKQDLDSAKIDSSFGELLNFNKLVGEDNFIGGKVGETLAAGQTSVSLHKIKVKDTERIVAIIVLGSKDRHNDVLQLLRYTETHFGS